MFYKYLLPLLYCVEIWLEWEGKLKEKLLVIMVGNASEAAVKMSLPSSLM